MIRTSDLKDLRNIEWLSRKSSKNYLQNMIFTTFHRVLDNMVVGKNLAKSLIIIQFIQLMTMIVNDKNPNLERVLPRDFLYFIKFPLVYDYLQDISFFYTYFFTIPIALFLCGNAYLFVKIYNMSERKHQEYSGLKSFFSLCMYLIDTILAIPIFGVCFKTTLCGESRFLPDCTSSIYFVSLLISIVLIVGYFIVQMCVGMFFFNFDFKMRDNLARSYNIMHLVFKMYCVMVVALDVYMIDEHQKLTTIFFIHFIFASIFCIDYYGRLPYYHRQVSEFYCYGCFGYFWISLVLLCCYLADYSLITDNVVYIILIGLGFFLYIVRTYREYFYRRLIIKEIDEIDNEIHLDARFRYLMEIVKNSKKNKQDELLLISIIKVHMEKCQEANCVCKKVGSLYDPKKKHESNATLPIFKNRVFIKNYQLMLILQSCIKLPKSSLLHIDMFLFYFKEMNNIPQVNHNIILFEKQSQQSLFVTVRYAIYRLKISIYYFLKDKNKNSDSSSIPFENIRVFDEEMKSLNKQCVKIVELYARMWDILGDVVPDIVLLEKVCTKLIDERSFAELTYQKILGVTNSSLLFLSQMTLYSKFIVFDDLLFSEVQEKLKKLVVTANIGDSIACNRKEFEKQFIQNDHGRQLINMEGPFCSISISFNKENLGQIVWSSESCYEIFGYESNYLRTFNVMQIMPSVISKKHNRFLEKYFETGREHLMGQLNHLWALNKNKNLFSIFLVLKLFISKEGLTVVSLIRRLNQEDYVILTRKGKVDCSGFRLRRMLEILPQEFYDKNSLLNIMTVAPKLIGLFLPMIYDYPEFTFSDLKSHEEFVEKYLQEFYVFVHDKIDKTLQTLSEKMSLQKASGNTNDHERDKEREGPDIAYFEELHRYLDKLGNENMRAIYRVSASIKKREFQDGVYLWELKIFDMEKINGTSVHPNIWAREMCLVDRLQLDDEVLNAIKNMRNKKADAMKDTANVRTDNNILANLNSGEEGGFFKKILGRANTIKKGQIEKEKTITSKPSLQKDDTSLALADPGDEKLPDRSPERLEGAPAKKIGGIGAKLFGGAFKRTLAEPAEKDLNTSGFQTTVLNQPTLNNQTSVISSLVDKSLTRRLTKKTDDEMGSVTKKTSDANLGSVSAIQPREQVVEPKKIKGFQARIFGATKKNQVMEKHKKIADEEKVMNIRRNYLDVRTKTSRHELQRRRRDHEQGQRQQRRVELKAILPER